MSIQHTIVRFTGFVLAVGTVLAEGLIFKAFAG
jgi:hypothetical protein